MEMLLQQSSQGHAACAAELPAEACLLGPEKAATSSQRSAGTVSDNGALAHGAAEVAQRAGSLKRQLSMVEGDADSQTSSQGCSKSHRSSLDATPARRAAAQRARALWAADGEAHSGDEAAESGSADDSGLEFLLRACEMLDPLNIAMAERAASMPMPGNRGMSSLESTPKITRQARHAASGSLDASPASAVLGLPPSGMRRPVSRRLLTRDVEDDGSEYDGGDADADYLPGGRTARASTRAQRASARAASASAAASAGTGAAAGVDGGGATATSAGGGGGGRGRWAGEPKQLVTGPCMNPDCEHPHDSPQWRKGPPQHPVLCNACGTRWLRNGTLKPLVPRRGLRYKNKPKSAKSRAAAAAAAAAARATNAAAPPQPVPPPIPSPIQHKQLATAVAAHPANSSEASDGARSEAEEPMALFSQQASPLLPMPAPLQTAVAPMMHSPFMPHMLAPPAMLFGNMSPAAAAQAAADAFKKAPQLFAGAPQLLPPLLPAWAFLPASQPPALFQPAPASASNPSSQDMKQEAGQQAGDAVMQDDEQCHPSLWRQQQQQQAVPAEQPGPQHLSQQSVMEVAPVDAA